MDPVLRIAQRHDGVLTREQALAAGMSASAVTRRVTSGRWLRVADGIYMPAGQPVTPRARLRIAVYRCGEGAAASGPSAAWWLGITTGRPRLPHVTIPRSRRFRKGEALVRCRDLDPQDVVIVGKLAVTATALTVLETAVILEKARRGTGTAFLDRALQTHIALAQLERAHLRNLGRSGSPCAAAMLRVAAEGGESGAERILLRLLRRDGVTGWVCGFSSCGYLIDLAFERERAAVEVDGWAFHRTADRMARDAVRQNALVAEGWTVLRFTYHRLVEHPDAVLDEITRALARARR